MNLVSRLSYHVLDRSREQQPQDDEWRPGCRYKALEPFMLHTDPWPDSPSLGLVQHKEAALLLDLWQDGSDKPATLVDGGEAPDRPLYGFVASTRRPEWRSGWVMMGGSSSSSGPKLGKQKQRGSWEVGGRYTVLGSPLLRAEQELESKQIGEVHKEEEVLIVQLALVMSNGEPRLRSRVRTDTGQLGWLTVELPWAGPLLRPLNLYSEEALRSLGPPKLRRLSDCNGLRSSRITVSGSFEDSAQAWEIGGKYRLLSKVPFYVSPNFTSVSVKSGVLKRGMLLEVREKADVMALGTSGEKINCSVAFVKVTGNNGGKPLEGWISLTGKNGKAILDARDHAEYDKVMRLIMQQVKEEDFQSPDTSKVPRLELESLRQTPSPHVHTKQPSPDSNETYSDDGEEPSPERHGKAHPDSRAVVLEAPHAASNAILRLSDSSAERARSAPPQREAPSTAAETPMPVVVRKVLNGQFVDARKAAENEADSDMRVYNRQPLVDNEAYSPSGWLSCSACSTCCGTRAFPTKVNTSGAPPYTLKTSREEYEEHKYPEGQRYPEAPRRSALKGSKSTGALGQLPGPPENWHPTKSAGFI